MPFTIKTKPIHTLGGPSKHDSSAYFSYEYNERYLIYVRGIRVLQLRSWKSGKSEWCWLKICLCQLTEWKYIDGADMISVRERERERER